MGDSRTTWSDEFIDDFKRIYARRGRDVDCVEELREKYRTQYPLLVPNQLTRLRLKRKSDFDSARSAHIQKVKEETSKREAHLLVRARDLNSRTSEILMESQEEYLYQIQGLNPGDDDYNKDKLSLLRVVTSLQKEINSFSGLDVQVSLMEYFQKLLRKKFVDENDISKLRDMLDSDGTSDGFSKKEKIPKTKFLESKKHEDD